VALHSRAFLLGCAQAQSVSVTLAEALAFLQRSMGGVRSTLRSRDSPSARGPGSQQSVAQLWPRGVLSPGVIAHSDVDGLPGHAARAAARSGAMAASMRR
jgi:hypothetical protein